MTKNMVNNLSFYSFKCDEPILIDANIWLYLFPPPSNPKKLIIMRKNNDWKRFGKFMFGLVEG